MKREVAFEEKLKLVQTALKLRCELETLAVVPCIMQKIYRLL
jgi:hypothetical protein